MTTLQNRSLSAVAALMVIGMNLYSFNQKDASAASFQTTRTLILYEADSGTIPSAPYMGFLGFPQDAALLTFEDGTTLLDTTLSGNETYAGWTSTAAATPGFPLLDRGAGFQVSFTLQLEDESHARNNRAGFSLIVLGEDSKGVELAFWENEIWVQSDEATGGLFSHGEGVAFPASAGLVQYQLAILGDTYMLTANGETILSGPVRDYSSFSGFPDPYETPNFLFLGDDTTSAQTRVRLSFLSVTGTGPVEPTVESASTSTNIPPPIVTTPPLPSSTLIPSPTPTEPAIEVCPSGLILLPMIFTIVWMHRKLGRMAR